MSVVASSHSPYAVHDRGPATMDDGSVKADNFDRRPPIHAPREVPIRESAPPSSRPAEDYHHGPKSGNGHGHGGGHSHGHGHGYEDHRPPHTSGDVWAGAIGRIQTQVSYNTSMLEAQRRQLTDCEVAVNRLSQDLGGFAQALDSLRAEMRSRPPPTEHLRHDPGDLDVLAEQVASVTSKANEVDELKLQLKLMKNQLKRMEDQTASPAASLRPEPIMTNRRESGSQEMLNHGPPGPHRHPGHHHHASHSPHIHPHPPPLQQQQQPPPPAHHALPPMRTSTMNSPVDTRPSSFAVGPPPPPLPAVPVLQSQHSTDTGRGTPPEPRHMELSKPPPPGPPGFRPAEPLPPPSSLSGWRPAEPGPMHSGMPPAHHGPPPPPPHGQPPPPPPPSGAMHRPPHAMEPDPQVTGDWQAVNSAPPTKRPFEEPRPSPYGSPVSGSPKRPKLAPIMPRGMHGEEPQPQYGPPGYGRNSNNNEGGFRPDSRAPSDVSQTPSQTHSNPQGDGQAYRFITSTASANAQDTWRPEQERILHVHQHHPGRGAGRGGRRGGRGRGRGRGGHGGQQMGQRMGTPPDIKDRSGWPPGEGSPLEGPYGPLQPYSPRQSHGVMGRRSGGPMDHEHEIPVTPQMGNVGLVDGMMPGGGDLQHSHSGNKKTRTKPIRNAEGILIRKDGRPDMRSVSSANNLRKVHAKKEAERVELEGKTPPPGGIGDGDEGSDDAGEYGSPGSNGEGNDMSDEVETHHHAVDQERLSHDPTTRSHIDESVDQDAGTIATASARVEEREHEMADAIDAKLDDVTADSTASTTAGANGTDEQQQPPTTTDVEMREGSTAPAPAPATEAPAPAAAKTTDGDTKMSEEPASRVDERVGKRPRRGTVIQQQSAEA